MGIFSRASHDTNLLISGIVCCVCQTAKEIWTIGIVPRHWRFRPLGTDLGPCVALQSLLSLYNLSSGTHSAIGNMSQALMLLDLNLKLLLICMALVLLPLNSMTTSKRCTLLIRNALCGGPSQLCQFLVVGSNQRFARSFSLHSNLQPPMGSQKCQSVKLWLCGRGWRCPEKRGDLPTVLTVVIKASKQKYLLCPSLTIQGMSEQ